MTIHSLPNYSLHDGHLGDFSLFLYYKHYRGKCSCTRFVCVQIYSNIFRLHLEVTLLGHRVCTSSFTSLLLDTAQLFSKGLAKLRGLLRGSESPRCSTFLPPRRIDCFTSPMGLRLCRVSFYPLLITSDYEHLFFYF